MPDAEIDEAAHDESPGSGEDVPEALGVDASYASPVQEARGDHEHESPPPPSSEPGRSAAPAHSCLTRPTLAQPARRPTHRSVWTSLPPGAFSTPVFLLEPRLGWALSKTVRWTKAHRRLQELEGRELIDASGTVWADDLAKVPAALHPRPSEAKGASCPGDAMIVCRVASVVLRLFPRLRFFVGCAAGASAENASASGQLLGTHGPPLSSRVAETWSLAFGGADVACSARPLPLQRPPATRCQSS